MPARARRGWNHPLPLVPPKHRLVKTNSPVPRHNPAQAAAVHGMESEVVRRTEAKRGFVLLPKRWVVERSFAWAARFRRLARDYERLSATLAGLHFLALACLMLASLLRPS